MPMIETSKNGGFSYDERSVLGNRTERFATKNLSIKLSVEDNAEGDPASAASCAISLAIKRKKQGVVATITGYKVLKVLYGNEYSGYYERYMVPKPLSRQLKEFDDPKHPRKAINYETFVFRPIYQAQLGRVGQASTTNPGKDSTRKTACEGGRNRPIYR